MASDLAKLQNCGGQPAARPGTFLPTDNADVRMHPDLKSRYPCIDAFDDHATNYEPA